MSRQQRQQQLSMCRNEDTISSSLNMFDNDDDDDDDFNTTNNRRQSYRNNRHQSVQFETMTMDFLSTLPDERKEQCINKFHQSYSNTSRPLSSFSPNNKPQRSKSVAFDKIALVELNFNDNSSDDDDDDDDDDEGIMHHSPPPNRRRSSYAGKMNNDDCRKSSFTTQTTLAETVYDDDLSLSSSHHNNNSFVNSSILKKNKSNKNNDYCLKFIDHEDNVTHIYEIESYKDTEYAIDMYYSKHDLDEFKRDNETTTFLMENPKLMKEGDEIITRGLESNTEDGAWERYERIRDATNAVIITQGELEMNHKTKKDNKNDWWDIISKEYSKEVEKAIDLAYQRGVADYQDTMEIQRKSIKLELSNIFNTNIKESIPDYDDDDDDDDSVTSSLSSSSNKRL